MDYRFGTLDFDDDSEGARKRRRAYMQAVNFGFHQERVDDDLEKLWLDHVATDDVVCSGAWLPDDAYGAGPMPVATTSWFDKTLNVGRGLLPLRMITDVTTSPAHRRRGLVRRLIEDCLADAVAKDLPLAALTVSEATIYGRWGFGVATFGQEVELDTGHRFVMRDFHDPGRVEQLDPREGWPVVSDQLDRFHRRTRGSVGTPAFYRALFTGDWSIGGTGPDKKLRGAVHLTPDERVDGVLLWRPEGRDGEKRKAKVVLHLGEDTTARLALWRFMAEVDLVNHVNYGDFPPADPLPWTLRDLNALSFKGRYEFLWVRVLDVRRALAARPWAADGEVVLEVADPLLHTGGRYVVTTRDGRAEVRCTDAAADLTLDSETLGSLSLGGISAAGLYAAGRITGDPDPAARFAAMADLAEEPYNILGF